MAPYLRFGFYLIFCDFFPYIKFFFSSNGSGYRWCDESSMVVNQKTVSFDEDFSEAKWLLLCVNFSIVADKIFPIVFVYFFRRNLNYNKCYKVTFLWRPTVESKLAFSCSDVNNKILAHNSRSWTLYRDISSEM